jgi:hypothetical protein
MSLTDRLNRAQIERHTGSSTNAPTDYSWQRKATSPFTRATGSLSLSGETELETLARELAMSRDSLAAAIGLSPAMMDRWLRGIVSTSGATSERLHALREIHKRLYANFQAYQVLDWLRTPNAELGFNAPADALAQGQMHRVALAIDELEGYR